MAKAATKKRTAKPKTAEPKDMVISTQQMADVLGLTPRRLQVMVKEAIVPSVGRGRFALAEVVKAYSSYLKNNAEKSTGSVSLDALRDEKAQEIRLNRMRKDRQLISLEEAVGTVDEIVGIFVASLNGLPAQITGVPRERQRLNGIFDAERQRLSDRFAKKRTALLTGDQASDAEAEDDAS